MYPIVTEVAREHGYALAVHGTMERDFDLAAIPWTENATAPEKLIRAIAERIGYTRDTAITVDRLFQEPYCSDKPFGRRAWSIPLDCGAYLDISVLPRATMWVTEAGK
jgi:hypothetical protein